MGVKVGVGKGAATPSAGWFGARLVVIFHTAGDVVEEVRGDEKDVQATTSSIETDKGKLVC